MEPHESHELVETMEKHQHQNNRAALIISIFAMILAINNVGGANSTKEATQNNIKAANMYSFFQAKSVRQSSINLAIDDLKLQLIKQPSMSEEAKEAISKKIEEYEKRAARYESDPETKEGKVELLEKAKRFEEERDLALKRDPWFDYSEGILQIAIVLLSVSILASLPLLFWVGCGIGGIGLVGMLNGFFLFFG